MFSGERALSSILPLLGKAKVMSASRALVNQRPSLSVTNRQNTSLVRSHKQVEVAFFRLFGLGLLEQ